MGGRVGHRAGAEPKEIALFHAFHFDRQQAESFLVDGQRLLRPADNETVGLPVGHVAFGGLEQQICVDDIRPGQRPEQQRACVEPPDPT